MTADTVNPITDEEIAAMVEWAVFYPSLDRPKKSEALEEKATFIQRIHARLAAAEAENARLRELLKAVDRQIEPTVKVLCSVSKCPFDPPDVAALRLGHVGDRVRNVLNKTELAAYTRQWEQGS